LSFIKFLGTSTVKYFKGLLAISMLWLLPALGIFIFDSCKKANYEKSNSGEAARKFNEAVDKARPILGSTVLNNSSVQSRLTTESADIYFVDFPDGTNSQVITDFSSNVNVQNLTSVLTNYGVALDDSINAGAEVIIQVPNEQIRTTLAPLVVEAKNYLYSKGVTAQQIADMLIEEDAEEIDLIPFVKTLTAIEQGQYTVRNIQFPLINSANALPHYLECAIAAIGGDAAYALAHSGASSWTWSTMQSVFKGVAKRFLGPIGVAIAVVSFTTCMLTT
jgi:hypothetical protein